MTPLTTEFAYMKPSTGRTEPTGPTGPTDTITFGSVV